jgi:hypothetical protein
MNFKEFAAPRGAATPPALRELNQANAGPAWLGDFRAAISSEALPGTLDCAAIQESSTVDGAELRGVVLAALELAGTAMTDAPDAAAASAPAGHAGG